MDTLARRHDEIWGSCGELEGMDCAPTARSSRLAIYAPI